MTLLLETRNVSKYYGAFRALEQVSMALHQGELVSVVGPNGAGKTTLVNLLTGLLEPSSGEVLFMGKNIAGVGPVELADHGLARAFQLIQIFPKLTVAETIAAAVVSRQNKRWRLFSRVSADREVGARVREVAEVFGLGHRLETVAAALSQGEKKLLDVASAFALDPQVILLDEPTSGVSTADKHGIMKTLIAAADPAVSGKPREQAPALLLPRNDCGRDRLRDRQLGKNLNELECACQAMIGKFDRPHAGNIPAHEPDFPGARLDQPGD